MADSKNSSSGFTLPPPNAPAPAPDAPASQATQAPQTDTGQGSVGMPIPPGAEGASSRDLLVGGGVLLVLMVAYFFAKNAYANMLVGRRVEPRSANAAGWWLFIFLTLISVGVVLAAVNRSALMTPFIVGPLALGAIVALVLMLLSSRR
jgi:hypothetical protein